MVLQDWLTTTLEEGSWCFVNNKCQHWPCPGVMSSQCPGAVQYNPLWLGKLLLSRVKGPVSVNFIVL